MKTIEAKKVYTNAEYEATTRAQLQAAKKLLQGLLDTWNKLNIGSCTDLNELLMRPERVYHNAIDKLVEVPSTGRFHVKKEVILSQLDLPDPLPLYQSAKVIRQQPFCASAELWEVVDDKVTLVEGEAFLLIDSQTIYAVGEKAQIAEDLVKLCAMYNNLNIRLGGTLLVGSPWSFNHFRGSFILRQTSNNGLYEIAPDIDFLRQVVR